MYILSEAKDYNEYKLEENLKDYKENKYYPFYPQHDELTNLFINYTKEGAYERLGSDAYEEDVGESIDIEGYIYKGRTIFVKLLSNFSTNEVTLVEVYEKPKET